MVYTGDRCTHRHPEFTSGSHEIGEDYLVEETGETNGVQHDGR